MPIPTSNDSIIHSAMVGRNARKDRESLSFNIYLNKLNVELDAEYLPVFSIPTFQQGTPVPSDTNYQRAMTAFRFYSRDYAWMLSETCQDMKNNPKTYKSSAARKHVIKEHKRALERHGSFFYKTLFLETALASDFPENAIVTPY